METPGDELQVERLKKRLDDGFAEMKDEFRGVRSEFLSLRAELENLHRSIKAMWLTMVFGFIALFIAMLVQS